MTTKNSFKKRVSSSSLSTSSTINQKKILPASTRLSPYNGQLLISTGVPSFDDILGGGLPVGTVLLIKEDRNTEYSKLLLKYFLAQGISSEHHVLLITAEENPKKLISNLPWVVANNDDNDHGQKDDRYQGKKDKGDKNVDDHDVGDDDKMTIAWRYKGLKKVESNIKNSLNKRVPVPINLQNKEVSNILKSQLLTTTSSSMSSSTLNKKESSYCEIFDLTKIIPNSILETSSKLITLIDGTNWINQENIVKDDVDGENQYETILIKLQKIIKENNPSNILRIGIHSIASPFWKARNSNDVFRFFHALRGLIRNTYSSAIITIPAYLYEPINASFIRKIEHICDAVVEIESFAGSLSKSNLINSTSFNGLFRIHKLPTINSLVPSTMKLSILSGGGSNSGGGNSGGVGINNNLGFKLRRKRFSIEVFHLPPEGEIKETKSNNDNLGINEQKNFGEDW